MHIYLSIASPPRFTEIHDIHAHIHVGMWRSICGPPHTPPGDFFMDISMEVVHGSPYIWGHGEFHMEKLEECTASSSSSVSDNDLT